MQIKVIARLGEKLFENIFRATTDNYLSEAKAYIE